MDNNPENAFRELEEAEAEDTSVDTSVDTAEVDYKKEQEQVTHVFGEIVNNAQLIIAEIPERAKKEGPRRLMEVAKRITYEDLEKQGLSLNAEQKVAIDELLEGILVKHESNISEPNKETETEAKTTVLTYEDGPEDRKESYKKAYLAEGGLTKLGEMAIKKMNMEGANNKSVLIQTLAVNTRRELGVNPDMSVKITPQDLITLLEK